MYNGDISHKLINSVLAQSADKAAFCISTDDGVININYGDFAKDILSYTNYFLKENLSGKHISIWSDNCYEWVVTLFALFASGNVVVPLNHNLPEADILSVCEQADTEVIICSNNLSFENPTLFEKYQILSFEQISGASPIDASQIYTYEFDETALLLSTSGTTGRSKLVELSSGNLVSAIDSLLAGEGTCWSRTMSMFPFFHAGGLALAFTVSGGGKTFCMGRGLKYIFADIPRLNPEFLTCVPMITDTIVKMAKRISSKADMENYLGSSLRIINCAGSKLSDATAESLSRFDLMIATAYGMSESGISAAYNSTGLHPDSIGFPNPGVEFKIAEDGELLIKSGSVMKGYYKDPEETAKVLINGWLHSGDLAKCDDEGYYYIIGRKKNVICLANGENVNPEEIEDIIVTCPAVEEILVYGDGKGICADIYSTDDTIADKFISDYNESVPMYRQIYKIYHFSKPLEKTSSGKLKRKGNK
ncbi:MAG: AMP-binding protein [Lachnospiraceae bacterium]|nr:AMP-binding protein [Candidatus Minthocola equi]